MQDHVTQPLPRMTAAETSAFFAAADAVESDHPAAA